MVEVALISPCDVAMMRSHIPIEARLFAPKFRIIAGGLARIDLTVGNPTVHAGFLIIDPSFNLVHAGVTWINRRGLRQGIDAQKQTCASN